MQRSWVLGFIWVGSFLGVLVVFQSPAWADPDRLQVGQITGTDALPDTATQTPSHTAVVISPLEATVVALDHKVTQLGDQSSVSKLVMFIGLIQSVVGILGLSIVYKWIKDRIEQEVKRRITDQFGRVDPTLVPVYVQDTVPSRKALFALLGRMGFDTPTPFARLEELSPANGCIVLFFSAPPEGSAHGTPSPDEAPLLTFLKTPPIPMSEAVGFVVYTAPKVVGSPTLLGAFDTLTFANTVVTIGTNVLTVARSLTPHFVNLKGRQQ